MAEQEVVTQETKQVVVVHDDGEYAMLFDSGRFAQAWRVAKLFSSSKLVPASFQGSPENCFIALHMAVRLELDPMAVMQKTYIIHGRPGMEAQLIIAMVNARGPFKGPIQWEVEGEGDNRKWTAYAIHRETGERCAAEVTMDMVKKEGWYGKEGSKWKTIPELMGRYRSATFLARLYCPEVIMGLSTVDELQDINGEVVDVSPVEVTAKLIPQTEKVKEKLKRGRKAPETPPEAPEPEAGVSQTPTPEVAAMEPMTVVRGITMEQLDSLRKVPSDLLADAFVECNMELIDLNELDMESATALLAWLAKQ